MIFHGKSYYEAFLSSMEEAHERFGAEVHAYCLMGNHYHLLLKTPFGNLSRIMQHINGLYTQRYNRLRGTDGPLFRGRYKALVVDADAYLVQVGRYIHRNPIETRKPLVSLLEEYAWSSYPAYVGKAKAPAWLDRSFTYSMLGNRQPHAGYKDYVERGVDEETLGFYTRGNQPSVIGEQAFRASLLDEHDSPNANMQAAVHGRPDIERVIRVVADTCKVDAARIAARQHGRQSANMPRKLAMYAGQQAGYKLQELADAFSVSNPGTVSNAISHVKAQMEADARFRNRVKQVGRQIWM